MVTREQMDTLSLRVGNILELVSDLRVENSQLKAEIEELKVKHEQYDRKVEEQGKETRRLREQLDERNHKLNQLLLKEEELENFLLQIIGQMDSVGLAEFQKQFAEVGELRIQGDLPEPTPAPKDVSPAAIVEVAFGSDGIEVSEATMADGDFQIDPGNSVEVMVRKNGEFRQIR